MKKHFLFLASVTFILTTISTALGQSHAFLWDPTTGIRDLGTLGGDSFATAVSDNGIVVGSYIPTDGRIYYHGFIWTEATGMVDIGVPGGGDSTTAEVFCTGVNSAGNVVGYGRQVDGRQVAFFWSPTNGFTTLGDISSRSDNGNTAYAINELDQVTGNLIVDQHGSIYHAYLWSPGMVQPRDLGTVDGGQGNSGLAINNHTKIVGISFALGQPPEPMNWTKKLGMSLIGMVPGTVFSQAYAINDAGQVVGLDETGTSDLAFYTAPGTGLRFLKGLGGNSTSARAINGNGVIVGFASDTTDATHAVMWATSTSAPVIFSTAAGNALGINNLGQIVGQGYFPQ